ncbi:MAG: C10 family peptidase, partial [Saprospiraceae bacterium]
MKNLLNLGFCFLVLIESLCAKHIDEKTAYCVAKNYITSQSYNVINLSMQQKVFFDQCIETNNPMVLYYIFSQFDNCFVIVAGDDRVSPILAYSISESFPSGTMPDHIKSWFKNYELQLEYILINKIDATLEIKNEWQVLLNQNEFKPNINSANADSLLKSKWGQFGFFNEQCPGRSPTGCVATAMAQILNYWKYPEKGFGANVYYENDYGFLMAEFGKTFYHWDSMPNLLSNPNFHIAQLMFQCGVAVEMDYNKQGSGAQIESAIAAFKNYFGYSESIHLIKRSGYDQNDWVDILKGELDAAQPIIFGGHNSKEGHVFIFDGYKYDKFHINWGWEGAYNGYYSIIALNPKLPDSFNINQVAIIGINPRNELSDIYEPNNTVFNSFNLTPIFIANKALLLTDQSTIHNNKDLDFYKIELQDGYQYTIEARVHDSKSSGNGKVYSYDVSFSYSFNNLRFGPCDDTINGNFTVNGGTTLYFEVDPYCLKPSGDYLLEIKITRTGKGGNVFGFVNTENRILISNTNLELRQDNQFVESSITSQDGKYSFSDLGYDVK